MSQAYSLIAKSKIISYEEGVRRGLHNIPKDISRKTKKRKRLNAKEQFVVDNRKYANEDIVLPPSERSLWLFDFAENHEEDNADESEEESDIEDSGTDESE